MTKKHSLIRGVLSNNKVVFIFSLLLAVVIWLVVSLQFSDSQEASFDIPVLIDETMSNKLDLQMFGQKDFTVSVKVKGKRYEVSSVSLKQEDFIVSASTVNVSAAGKYSLPVSVRLKDSRDIEIVSFSPESLDVYFDYSLTETYPVQVQVVSPDGKIAADGYIEGEPVASSTEITISGALAEIQKIDKVTAKVTLDAPLTRNAKFENVSLSVINASGGVIRSSYVDIVDNVKSVTVTVPIFKVTQLEPFVRFKNRPSYFTENPIRCEYSPAGLVRVAVSTELLDSTESLSIGTIDFADVKIGSNQFTFRAQDIQNIRVLDDIDEFRVSFTLDGFQSRTFTLNGSDILFNSLPEGVQASVAEDTQYTVTVIGLRDEIETLTARQIVASVDADGLTAQEQPYSLPVAFTIDGTTSCWVSSPLTADVTVS